MQRREREGRARARRISMMPGTTDAAITKKRKRARGKARAGKGGMPMKLCRKEEDRLPLPSNRRLEAV